MDGNTWMQPQMLEGFAVEEDGKRWQLKLREGLLWHDGEKVLARRLRRFHRAVGGARRRRLSAQGAHGRNVRA